MVADLLANNSKVDIFRSINSMKYVALEVERAIATGVLKAVITKAF